MGTVTTDRAVNPGQLTAEVGGKPTHVIGPRPDGTTTVAVTGLGDENLAAAIDAHVADPGWVDPNRVSTDEERAGADIDAIRTKAKAVFDGSDTFTAAQSQKILAALVLRATR